MPTVRSREEWQQLLAEHAAGEQTIRAFCHDKEIGLSTFSAWKRRLAGTQGPSVVKRRAFVPVTVTQRSDVTVAVGPATVTLSSSVDPQWLAAFIKALRG